MPYLRGVDSDSLSDAAERLDPSHTELGLVAAELLPLGPLWRFIAEQRPAVRRAQGRRLLEQILEAIGTSEEDLLARVQQVPRVFWLLSDAVDAAQRARETETVDALSRLAQSGLRDDARLDEADFMIGVVAQLEAIHFRALEALEALTEPTDRRDGIGVDVSAALNTSTPVAEALCSHLIRLALAETPGMSFRGLQHEVIISPLGLEVLRLLRTRSVDVASGGEGERQSVESTLPPWWRAIRTPQIEVSKWLPQRDEAAARGALADAGFIVREVARLEGDRVAVEVCAPTDVDGDQCVYDAVAAVLHAAGITNDGAGSSTGHSRVGFAYHEWRRVLVDGEPATFEDRPLKMLTGPGIDVAPLLESFARWLSVDRQSVTIGQSDTP